jgi:hypothetical protein
VKRSRIQSEARLAPRFSVQNAEATASRYGRLLTGPFDAELGRATFAGGTTEFTSTTIWSRQ